MNDWWEKFITFDIYYGKYIAWDETRSNILGWFSSPAETKEAILEYAKTLNKKESKMDFQVGDKVVCLLKGPGVVSAIENDSVYAIVVSFGNGASDWYTKLGFLYDEDEFPCLFHEGTEINIKPAEPKRYPWANIYHSKYGVASGGSYSTKEEAEKFKSEWAIGTYIDTIQLKPKED